MLLDGKSQVFFRAHERLGKLPASGGVSSRLKRPVGTGITRRSRSLSPDRLWSKFSLTNSPVWAAVNFHRKRCQDRVSLEPRSLGIERGTSPCRVGTRGNRRAWCRSSPRLLEQPRQPKSPDVNLGTKRQLPGTLLFEGEPSARATENEVIEQTDTDDLSRLGEAPGEVPIIVRYVPARRILCQYS